MCGSLLTAVGLPDLITFSLQEYEKKAVQLGRNPKRLVSHKRYLAQYRTENALFNMVGLVADLECALSDTLYRPR